MRLQRLEIAGFKSFSDRSELAFDEGVTAIVGPNGCGKSNVADAITWVLGEQSAKSLRGEKMEDVIFNGSDARKATGTAEVRLHLADVTSAPAAVAPTLEDGATISESSGLTHENGHGNGNGNGNGNGHGYSREVEVIRRLYRSGESEYLIDGQQCRLRDVHELLMDTGLGAKAYAIIEQGKIGMILSSRPADRRQLIEEAAGITKYKARRRSAELKLEAAQHNLTRIDDIIDEVEKQRGTLKRQAAKARRYQRLRHEMRRWEKVLFAGKYRELRSAIDAARDRLSDARARETAAAADVARLDGLLAAARISLAEAESRATAAREEAHARELDTQRRQQQIEFDRQQVSALETRARELDAEVAALEARREPGRLALEERRAAAQAAASELTAAADALAAAQQDWQLSGRELEGLEGDVEAARSEVFAAINAATALRHAIEHAVSARERVSEVVGRLDVEDADLSIEREALASARRAAEEALAATHAALGESRAAREAHEAALRLSRAEHEAAARELRTREHDLAALSARLRSLEELDAARTAYGDAARVVLAQANGAVNQLGAVADYLEVDRDCEKAVEALLGELLQAVVVPTHGHAAAGLQLVREHAAGRCAFVVIEGGTEDRPAQGAPPDGFLSLGTVVRTTGPHAEIVRRAIGDAWIAGSLDEAIALGRETGATIATRHGDIVRGAHIVSGGDAAESRGILVTKGEIRDLREQIGHDRGVVASLAARVSAVEAAVREAQQAIEAATADAHRHEKALVAHEAQLARAAEEDARLTRKAELLALDRRRAEQEGQDLDVRQTEARESLSKLEAQQRDADERLNGAQRRLFAARESAEQLNQRVAGARAAHAGLTERSAALQSEVGRLEEAARELDSRVMHLREELAQKRGLREMLGTSIERSLEQLDADVRSLDALHAAVRDAEDAAARQHADADGHESALRDARSGLDAVRAEAGDLEVARATSESDLAHLSAHCLEVVEASLDDVLAEVERLEQEGGAVPDASAIAAADAEDAGDEDGAVPLVEGEAEPALSSTPPEPAPPQSLTAEGAIAALKGKIDRMGPVNMMAIEQFDELETRHSFLTTQRRDLVDSIAQTVEAIARIDETSKARFREAFTTINQNFQRTFSTLFGGGRAGITLLDENDPLESGIDIVASPPGKRLQSVQLLSGGEKALTAIALMFGIFQYKPSPFCLLDEIDAPLDDANIGRFIEMLKGMLHHTQFILITHNRKTMEIADRLYGVTMEEPGVSKLISVRLN
jgi:chromosome segregation protein